jgi:hypothetical protein
VSLLPLTLFLANFILGSFPAGGRFDSSACVCSGGRTHTRISLNKQQLEVTVCVRTQGAALQSQAEVEAGPRCLSLPPTLCCTPEFLSVLMCRLENPLCGAHYQGCPVNFLLTFVMSTPGGLCVLPSTPVVCGLTAPTYSSRMICRAIFIFGKNVREERRGAEWECSVIN